jgi:hypothetical protein
MPEAPKQNPNPNVKRNGTGRIRISASMRPGMDLELDRLAAEDGMNKSQVLQKILCKEIARRRRTNSGN